MEESTRQNDAYPAPQGYQVSALVAERDELQVVALTEESTSAERLGLAIHYDEARLQDVAYVATRREQLSHLAEYLEELAAGGVVARKIALLELDQGPGGAGEPLLVVEACKGTSLLKAVEERWPQGMPAELALQLMARLGDLLVATHQAGYYWRDFDPRRFVLTEDLELRAQLPGAVVSKGVKLKPWQLSTHPAYTAPEVRDEASGTMLRSAADIYGAGALMSFLLSGEEPRARVESPLSYTAYERIEALELPGLTLLLARTLQPLAKKRFGRAEVFRKYLALDALPTREMKGFGMVMLPAPWLGLEMENPEKNRALKSHLSSGPLISVAVEPTPVTEDEAPPAGSADSAVERAQERAEATRGGGLSGPLLAVVIVLIIATLAYLTLGAG
ncbi:hypothetical protein DL240_13025 [Lujinxingia litoralis]|uniref:Protein kinase domain-containing protein n=1 Tax=Lujinxingia litoralis TaxID=2211119 RepID=A0A328C7Y9_9DELT|nr:serine/threonine-protein kinase [Lujinxingia litoralis]RAL21768.1 hypothetical protein DL240_13025 [Lujinxingia litoralis]